MRFDGCLRPRLLATADILDASVLTAPLAERYEGWASAGGRAILAGERSLADLADRSLAPGSDPQPRSGRQKYLESLGTIMHIEASFNHDRLRGIADDNWRVSEQDGTPLAMTATGIHLTGLADGGTAVDIMRLARNESCLIREEARPAGRHTARCR